MPIDEALRNDGTSHHYQSPAQTASLDAPLHDHLRDGFSSVPVHAGRFWTTDAPYRETESAIAAVEAEDVHAVEMEAAALYAFAEARDCPIACFAHVTNQMAVEKGNVEKGEADGVRDAFALTSAAVEACEPLLSNT